MTPTGLTSVSSENYHMLTEWDRVRLQEFKNGKYHPFMARIIMQYLYEQGQIPGGDYVIEG